MLFGEKWGRMIVFLLHYKSCESSTYNYERSDSGKYVRVGSLSGTGYNWSVAQVFCENEFGSNLASFHSSSENSDGFGDGSWYSTYGQMWIGLNDIEIEGDYVWIDGTPLDFENWSGRQNIKTENCIRINTNDGRWNDLSCSTLFQASVCNYNESHCMSVF